MFKDNKNFYPTPPELVEKMIGKIVGHPNKILEPSAGKGSLINGLNGCWDEEADWRSKYKFKHDDISAIEKDPELQAILRGKGLKLIDTDFLAYSGQDKYDLIIANPPFDEGEKHLMKAIDIMYTGQIIFLLNAETIKNPHTNLRKELVKRLNELEAEVEYIEGAFEDAERKTKVEIALVDIVTKRRVEDDLFAGADDVTEEVRPEIEDKYEVSRGKGKAIEELVAEYNQIIDIGTETITAYYKNYPKIWCYIGLNKEVEKYNKHAGNMTAMMQEELNKLIRVVRVDFWRRTLDLEAVRKRLTAAKQSEFEHSIKERSNMDFTENNIRAFILNLIGSYEQTITDSVLATFDLFTKHGYRDSFREENIHYFNGWKTNDAFKVGKRVVIPIYGSYGGPFTDYSGWSLDYDVARKLNDIDLVINYFDGMDNYTSMSEAIKAAFAEGQNTKIKSTYFTVNCYKKGTIHMTFNDMDILRRFNVTACKGKGWLPEDYAAKPYKELSCEEKETVDTFEGKASYAKNINRVLIPTSKRLQITA